MLVSVGPYEIEYHITGNGPLKIVLIPGGPGLTLDYLLCVHDLLKELPYTVISYNLSGSGKSNNTFFKSVKAYAHELHQLLTSLDATEAVVLGHSFGSSVLHEYLLNYPHNTLKAVIFCNGYLSGWQLIDAIKKRGDALPDEFHEARRKHLAEGDGNAYDTLLFTHWIPKHVCRIAPLPEQLMNSAIAHAQSPMHYYFVGSDILDISGPLKNWYGNFKSVVTKKPALFISGTHDYLGYDEFQKMVNEWAGASSCFIEGTSHFPMHENPEAFKDGLIKFLNTWR